MPQLYEYRIHRERIDDQQAFELGLAILIGDDAGLARFFRARLIHQDREQFFVGYLDANNKLVGYEMTAMGSLMGVDVHPREVFRGAILGGAGGLVVAHNHPSGKPTPSAADDELTERLVTVGELLGIPVLDHIIVADISHYSYANAGRYIKRLKDE